MAQIKQKLALDKIIENRGNVSKSMREVGYSKVTAKNPKKNLIETQGFQELLNERGLTDNFLIDALVEDIELKPQNRKAELELGFKIKGRIKEVLDLEVKDYIDKEKQAKFSKVLEEFLLKNAGNKKDIKNSE